MWKSWGISVNFLKCNKHTVGKVFFKSPHVIEIHSKYSRATWHDIQDLHQDNTVCIWGIRYIQNYIKIWIIFNYIKIWVHRSSLLFFFWLQHAGIFVPWPGIKTAPPAVEVQSLNHWTTRKVAFFLSFSFLLLFSLLLCMFKFLIVK